jgi:hypothetical protein
MAYLHTQYGTVYPFEMLNSSHKKSKFYKAIWTEIIGIHPMKNNSNEFIKKAASKKNAKNE